VLTDERTWQLQLSDSSPTHDPDGCMDARDSEEAQHRNHQRHGTYGTNRASEPNTPLSRRRATDRDVDQERVEVSVGPGGVQRFKPCLKLVLAKPPLRRRAP
jgi:hypothetical protein